jgi:hypothetical protein
MYKNATKCNETIGKWCKNKHGASKIIDTFETYQAVATRNCPQLIQFLNRPDISFASVDKRQDTPKLEALGARIQNHVDLQDHFNIPFQPRTGLANMAKLIIDRKFKDYKEDFRNKKRHNTWHLWEL